ncbi:MAG: glycosyl hydrolase 115 family protein [Bacteroidaceae bacterium]|nr:glycosyl hydrolase 115 family protein [Bacteroidaceae bacterium]
MKKLFLTIALLGACCMAQAQFVWQSHQTQQVACAENEHVMIRTTLGILDHDSRMVLGDSIVVNNRAGNIVVGTAGVSNLLTGIDVTPLKGLHEGFMLKVGTDHKLYVVGSDSHGTAYGIIELTRLLGVSPWEFWADVAPRSMDKLELPAGYQEVQSPSVEFRGIFINDEDWGLTRWNSRDYEPPYRPTRPAIGPDKTARIFELLLRLRANTYWPPMHESNQAFFLTEGNREVAEQYGIYIGSSHCEPMGCNAAVEWTKRGTGEYNFIDNREGVMKFWEDRVKEVKNQEIFYTVGMRGLHDWGMAGANTVEERKVALDQVIKAQRELLAKHVNPDVKSVPQMFIPYKEVLDVYNAGLEVPDDVTLMWPDDNYGYVTHYPTEKEKQRSGGNGIYYHVSYWGLPHDYLWLGTFSPGLLYQQMNQAYDSDVRKIWILNVGDIKPIEYQTELFLDMAWNIQQVRQQGPSGHLAAFLEREFGPQAGRQLMPLMTEHYRLAYIHKPEHMGNSYVYIPIERLEVSDMPWSGNYIRQRIKDYKVISDQAEAIGKQMPYDREDAYFHLVKYPVQATAQMNNKFLYAQLARHGQGSWKDSDLAFDSIARLTSDYNYGIHNQGKWRRMMDFQPRKLPVFEIVPKVQLDTQLLSDEPIQYAWNGSEYSKGTGQAQDMLGYEGKAASYPKGDKQQFQLGAVQGDSIHVRICFLPTFPANNQQIRLSVALDKQPSQSVSYETHWHSSEWCENVLFNQSVKEVVFKNDGKNSHTLTLQALDEGVVVDQIKVY